MRAEQASEAEGCSVVPRLTLEAGHLGVGLGLGLGVGIGLGLGLGLGLGGCDLDWCRPWAVSE